MTMDFDGWMILATGALAVVAAGIAYCGVLRQIGAQEKAAKDEASRHRSAIASALRAEITDFRELHVEPFLSKKQDGNTVKFFDRGFRIYVSNAWRIGELGAEACARVVRFYDLAFDYFGAVDRYLQKEGDTDQTKFFDNEVSAKLPGLKEAAAKAEDVLSREL